MDIDNANDGLADVSMRPISELLPIERCQPVGQVPKRSIPELLPIERHQSQRDLDRGVPTEHVIPVVHAQLNIWKSNISPNNLSRRGLPAPFNIRGRRPSQECLKMPSLAK